jgi:hypothetical protein
VRESQRADSPELILISALIALVLVMMLAIPVTP